MAFMKVTGYCPICESEQNFIAEGVWLRDDFLCPSCRSVPRQRALMVALNMFRENWRSCTIHEGSPTWTGTSSKLERECNDYSYSFYDPSALTGVPHPAHGWRNENLECLELHSGTVDLFITQDVFEHLFEPHLAIAEIARTLKPGGAHICTVPLSNGTAPSCRRAQKTADGVRHLLPAIYHGDPIDSSGTLVTIDWGYDIAAYLDGHSGLKTTIVYIDDLTRGIRAQAIEVLVMQKMAVPVLL